MEDDWHANVYALQVTNLPALAVHEPLATPQPQPTQDTTSSPNTPLPLLYIAAQTPGNTLCRPQPVTVMPIAGVVAAAAAAGCTGLDSGTAQLSSSFDGVVSSGMADCHQVVASEECLESRQHFACVLSQARAALPGSAEYQQQLLLQQQSAGTISRIRHEAGDVRDGLLKHHRPASGAAVTIGL